MGTTPLRGRDRERARLVEVLRHTGRGNRSLLVIEGPGGIGRTRLLHELVTAAQDARGVTFALSGPVPFPAVRRMAGERESLAGQLTGQPGKAVAGPVLVAWDDPDWTDPRLLSALATGAPSTPILWALTRRSAGGPQPDGPDVVTVELGPLAAHAVGDLLADLLGAPPSADLAELAGAASGRPRAVVDLVTGLRDEGLVYVDGGHARLRALRLPEHFGLRVRGELARMSPRARQLVQVGSAVGPSLRVPELAELLRGTAAGLLPAVEEALSSGLLVCAGDALSFSHELVRGIVAGTVPRAVRGAMRDEAAGIRATPVRAAPRGGARTAPATGWESLSEPERAIARLVSQALTNRQIATRVRLSPHTVNYHLRQIYRKLDINSRVQLAGVAQAHLADPRTARSAS